MWRASSTADRRANGAPLRASERCATRRPNNGDGTRSALASIRRRRSAIRSSGTLTWTDRMSVEPIPADQRPKPITRARPGHIDLAGARILARPAFVQYMLDNQSHVHRLFASLADFGVVFEWEREVQALRGAA